MTELKERRPLKVRDAKYAQQFAKWLSKKNITPNTISVMSVVFALFSAICFIFMPYNNYLWLPLLAAVFIQLRLLCNLFDGMVAVEGGKSTKSGELYNDIPDRIADPLIIVAIGYSIPMFTWGESLGWLAGLLAVMTAYIRTLASSMGAPTDFRGPMAKQHRMALITFACLATIIERYIANDTWSQGTLLLITLIVLSVGSLITVWRRISAAYHYLEDDA